MHQKKILLLGSFGPSLINFRGPLISEMVRRGHHVIAAAPSIDENTAAALRAIGAEPVSVQLSNTSLNPLSALASWRALRLLIRERRPDVLFAYTIKPVVLGAFAARAEKVPKVVSMITGLGFPFLPGVEPRRLLSRAAAKALYRAALARSSVVLFQNNDDKNLFLKLKILSSGQRTAVVNGSGVDVDHFATAPLPTAPAFLMIARLLKDKGIREFAEAAKRIKSEFPDVPVELVGYLDPSPDSLSQAALDELIGHGIRYHGKLDDVRAVLSRCSVYVLPSYREGMPRSVLEAMAMGRPVITTDVPGCRETVVDGENGVLIPPRDADALYRAMASFIHNPCKLPHMGAASRRRAEELYDVRRVNQAILSHAGL